MRMEEMRGGVQTVSSAPDINCPALAYFANDIYRYITKQLSECLSQLNIRVVQYSSAADIRDNAILWKAKA